MLRKIAPVLPVYNINASILFYRKLTFETYNFGNYFLAKKDKIEIHFYEWTSPAEIVASTCFIYDDNIHDLFSRFSSMDVINPVGQLKPNGRGTLEFQITDNNGNVLIFGEMKE